MTRIAIIGGHAKVALELSGILSKDGAVVTSIIRNPDDRDDVAATGATPLVLDVDKATVSLEACEREVVRRRASLAIQRATAEHQASVGKAPTWRLAAAIDELERAERDVAQCAQRLRELLKDLAVQYAAVTRAFS
jgi:hypothetical protein